jgi:hypothetical protein
MSQNIYDDELKYMLIEKRVFSLLKAIEKLSHFILSKNIEVNVPLSAIKFLLS